MKGNGGIGILAMYLAIEEGCRIAREQGVSAVAIRNWAIPAGWAPLPRPRLDVDFLVSASAAGAATSGAR